MTHAAPVTDLISPFLTPSSGTYLIVGNDSGLTEAVMPLLPSDGRVFVHDEPLAQPAIASAPRIASAERLSGALVAANDHPSITDVIAFAETPADARSAVARLTQSRRASVRSVGEATALDRLMAGVAPADIDLVVVDDRLLAAEVVRKTLGAGAFLVAGITKTFGGAAAFRALSTAAYELLSVDAVDRALFARRAPRLPVRFFTVLASDDPLIRYHHAVLITLPFRWHWHVVDNRRERGDAGGGLRDYLTALAEADPDRVSLHHPGGGRSWRDEKEILNEMLASIGEESLLWRIDANDLWTAEQIIAVRKAFVAEPDRTAAWFWCRYYLAPDRGIATRYNYAQDPARQWLRVWRFTPGMTWDGYEPPVLRVIGDEGSHDVGRRFPFTHAQMEAIGAVFDRLAYAGEAQGDREGAEAGHGAAARPWPPLHHAGRRSVHLRDYVDWVSDETMVDTVERLGWTPLAEPDPRSEDWRFRDAAEVVALRRSNRERAAPLIVVDGVFFQLSNTGIARVWINLLQEWCRSGFGDQVVLLDRGGTAPRIDGVRYHSIDRHSWATIDGDARDLQAVCDRLGATMFLSTYYTTPTRTPTVFMGYDMIPEALGFGSRDPWWRQKRRAIQHACAWVMISHSAAAELARHFPFATGGGVLVAPCSVDPIFTPCGQDELVSFRQRHGLGGDFVMLVGERLGLEDYKNSPVVFAALALMPKERRPLLVCVGGSAELEGVGKALLDEDDVRLLRLDDQELRRCYGASLAYICPSLMEGFGLPILEAMAVGTPALVCSNSSIPEVAGEAGVYFDPFDPLSLIDAIEATRDPGRRAETIAAGRGRVRMFDQARTARLIADHCLAIAGRTTTHEPDRAILADILDEAEALREATNTLTVIDRRTARIEAALDAATGALERTGTGDAKVDADMIAAARDAIAHAATDLCDLRRPLDDANDASSAEDAIPVDSTGLSRLEGPFPEFGMFKAFRWQIAPTSTTAFALDRAFDAWLEVDFGNVEQGQHVLLRLDDRLLCGFHPVAIGWKHVWRIRVPVSMQAGTRRVSVEASTFGGAMVDGRSMYVAIYAVRVLKRTARPDDCPSIVDFGSPQAGKPPWTEPALEFPARLLETNGLGPVEGPFPQWDIVRPFRWQTSATSQHQFAADGEGHAIIQVTFSNVQHDQQLALWQDQTLLHRFAPPAVGWRHQWRVAVPVFLPSGTTTFRIEASRCQVEGEGDRSLFIGLYDVLLLFPSGTDTEQRRVVDVGNA